MMVPHCKLQPTTLAMAESNIRADTNQGMREQDSDEASLVSEQILFEVYGSQILPLALEKGGLSLTLRQLVNLVKPLHDGA